MRRAGLILLLALLALPAAAAARPPRAQARLSACRTALDAPARYAVFVGTMRSLRAGRDRMQMRFDLYRRPGGSSSFRRVSSAGLGLWNPADPSVRRFRYVQRVANLSVPATYRAVVSFRWLNASGRVFARTRRVTAACRQPDLRPNLRIGRIVLVRVLGAPNLRRYDVTVRNDGGTAARDFEVALTDAGAPVDAGQRVALLPAGARTVVEFTGPRCVPGDPLVATADTRGTVGESNETDNSLTMTCPSVGG